MICEINIEEIPKIYEVINYSTLGNIFFVIVILVGLVMLFDQTQVAIHHFRINRMEIKERKGKNNEKNNKKN